MDDTRAMLDELMGKDRNVPLAERKVDPLKFSDREVCKYNLAGLCPYGLFKNTRSDLGACKYEIHEENRDFEHLQEDYNKLSDREKERYGFERELLGVLTTLVRDMNRKIERQRERAELESSARQLTTDDKARLEAIKASERAASDRSAQLAQAGDVDGSQLAANQAENYKRQHDALHKQLTAPERIMTVCEVCGVFINSTDNEQRRLDHLEGKQYLGWKAIREKHKELEEKYAGARPGGLPPPPGAREMARDLAPPPRAAYDDRHRSYDRGHERHHSSSSRHREHGDRGDRGRDYERHSHRSSNSRHRSRSRERRHRERERNF